MTAKRKIIIGVCVCVFMLCFVPRPASAEQFWLTDNAGDCVLDSLETAASSTNMDTAIPTSNLGFGHRFASGSSRPSGTYTVNIRGSHDNSGGNRQVSVSLVRTNSGCTQVQTLVSGTCTSGKGESNWTCNLTNSPGAVTFGTNESMVLFISAAASGHTLQWNNSTSPYDSYVDIPAADSPPSVTTNAASAVDEISATLNGNFTDGGSPAPSAPATVGFAYGTDSTLNTTIATTSESGTTGTFSENIGGLQSGVTYYFRAYVTNANGAGYGSILNFTTGTDTTLGRIMRLFEGYTIKLIDTRLILYGQ